MSSVTVYGDDLPTVQLRAVNSARNVEGSIHDDKKAGEMGYQGGLVPGVTMLGYMMRVMREAFGEQWLRTGRFSGRLRRPTYEGAEVTARGKVVEQPSPENDFTVLVELEVMDSDGRVTATGRASCRLADQQPG